MSLRWRITLCTSALIALAALSLGVFTYWNVSQEQTARTDEDLYAAISQARVKSLRENPRPPQPGVEIPIALGMLDRGGDVAELTEATNAGKLISIPKLTEVQVTEASRGPITVDNGVTFRVAIAQSKRGGAMVIAAAPQTKNQEALRQLAAIHITGALVVSLVGGLISFFLVRRFFRPVEEMVTSAERIAQGELDERVPVAKAGTELGRLSASLNSMIASLTSSVATLAASETAVRKVIADASHEIRTPLTVIRGYVELLLSDSASLDPKDMKALRRIDVESRRLEHLVTQLLILEKVEAQNADAHEVFDVSPLLLEALSDLQVLDPARNIQMDIEEAEIRGSSENFKQAITNLVQNVLRHTPQGSAVRATCEERESNVILTLDDSGPGIPAEKRASVISRFTQLHSAGEPQSSPAKGFGLGMTIITSVVSQLEGSIDLSESSLGGLRVTIRLPSANGKALAQGNDP